MWMLMLTIFFPLNLLAECKESQNAVRLTNVECIPNESWVKETKCFLKIQRNNTVLIYGRGFLYRTVTSAKARIQVFRWHNGFRPFLIDIWLNVCDVFAHKIKLDVLKNVIYDIIVKHSNLNHTCPYYGEILVPLVAPDLSAIPSLISSGKYRAMITFVNTATNEQLFKGHVNALISSSLQD